MEEERAYLRAQLDERMSALHNLDIISSKEEVMLEILDEYAVMEPSQLPVEIPALSQQDMHTKAEQLHKDAEASDVLVMVLKECGVRNTLEILEQGTSTNPDTQYQTIATYILT